MLPPLLHTLGLDPEIVRFPDQYRYQFDPFPPGHMADVYSSFDVLVNPAMGEGFGLPVLEAHACGVPAIVTDFTAMSEVCGAGWKVGYDRVWTPMRAWQAWPRVDEVVESLEDCHALSTEARAELSRRAREHALAYDADRVLAEHWLPALEEVSQRLADREPITIPALAR
jgi:glycosyltransferase involved in cell wall biosynthesis